MRKRHGLQQNALLISSREITPWIWRTICSKLEESPIHERQHSGLNFCKHSCLKRMRPKVFPHWGLGSFNSLMLCRQGVGKLGDTACKLEVGVGRAKRNQIHSVGCKEAILTSPFQRFWKLNKCFVPLVNVPLYGELNPTSGIQDPSRIKECKIFPNRRMHFWPDGFMGSYCMLNCDFGNITTYSGYKWIWSLLYVNPIRVQRKNLTWRWCFSLQHIFNSIPLNTGNSSYLKGEFHLGLEGEINAYLWLDSFLKNT